MTQTIAEVILLQELLLPLQPESSGFYLDLGKQRNEYLNFVFGLETDSR